MSADDYQAYVEAEWNLFLADSRRAAASLQAVTGLTVRRVLDIGCGGGQELLPFVIEGRALGVGVDVAPDVGVVGRQRLAAHAGTIRVAFMRAAAESLPFLNESFEVVICRIALPYTDNSRALDEIARVLTPNGICLLKIHHARFYLRQLRLALWRWHPRSAVNAVRVLAAGAIYHVSGTQPRNRITGQEAFQTRWLLHRELERRGLGITGELPDSNPATPSFIISPQRITPQ